MLRDVGAQFDKADGAKDGTWPRPDETDLDLHLEGGHSARRVAHAADMTGREVERALLEAVAALAARARRSRSTRRSTSSRSRSTAAPRCAPAPTCSTSASGKVDHHPRARDGPRDRRGRQGLPLHDQPRRRDGRRRRDGVPRGRRGREHGVLPVPPDLPLPPAGAAAFSSPRPCAARARSCAGSTGRRS